MATVVLGVGSSHGPTMHTEPDHWLRLGVEDRQDPRFDFTALKPGPAIENELAPERLQERYDRCQRAIGLVSQALRDAAPDTVIVLSNPHGGVDQDRMQPTFGIYLDDPPPVTTRYPRQRALTVSDPAERREGPPYPTDGSLARHLMQYLVDDGFDLACAFQSRPGANLDEAFTLLQRIYDPAASVAYVPFAISRYLPNQATPRRCYQLGNALRRAVEAWDVDRRVVIMASGGLSHQIIDEALDRSVIDALVSSDSEALCSVSRERLNGAPGTPEIANWIACAGSMEPRAMTLVDYIPCYRSAVGTGQGVTFGIWRP